MTVSALEILAPGDAWLELVHLSDDASFYQHPGYHALAESRGEGRARLFVLRQGEEFIALPLLLRPIPSAAGEGSAKDATSVYGYPGPFSRLGEPPRLDPTRFHELLRRELVEREVAAVFSRLHPLGEPLRLLRGLGEVVTHGEAVALDLDRSDEERRARYRKNHRRDIARLVRAGVTVREDRRLEALGEFARLYAETMRRVAAASSYQFGSDYFERLCATAPGSVRLFVCSDGDRLACAGVFLLWRGVVDYHLSGTASEYRGRAPLKLLLDGVAAWARARGEHSLHLGGGLGSRADALFHFKLGFGGRRRPFRTWRWIVQPATYEALCRRRDVSPADGDPESFFPAYRRPAD